MFQRNDGNIEFKHENTDKVMAIPYDIPIVGYQNEVINTLRLWSAEPVEAHEDFADESSHYLP